MWNFLAISETWMTMITLKLCSVDIRQMCGPTTYDSLSEADYSDQTFNSCAVLTIILQSNLRTKVDSFTLKGHCHGDFSVFWSKQHKYFTKNLLLTEIALRTPGRKYQGISPRKN